MLKYFLKISKKKYSDTAHELGATLNLKEISEQNFKFFCLKLLKDKKDALEAPEGSIVAVDLNGPTQFQTSIYKNLYIFTIFNLF